MFIQKMMRKSAFLSSFTGLIKLASLAKISFMVGSYTAFFSATSVLVPIAGVFGGIAGSVGIFGINILLRFLIFGTIPLYFLAYHVPGFCASLYWARQHDKWISVVLPLICMILFIAHPLGFYAAPYSFYWLVPIVFSFITHNNLFLHALSSTFIAHAVGSVIWLYTVPMTITAWYLLLPVVAVERIAFALGMVLLYKVINYIQQMAQVKMAHLSMRTSLSLITKFVK